MYYTDLEISRLFGEKIDELEIFQLIKPHPSRRNIYLVNIADLESEPTKKKQTLVQQAIRETCAYNQKFIDPMSNESLAKTAQLHHHLISRAMVIKNTYAYLIHCTVNCLMLNPDTHLNSGLASDKQLGASILTSLYGTLPEVWYSSFPTKIPFPLLVNSNL